ncbi:MAG: hypothetical protein FJ388_07695, partial [Verrucomicrobia bacterium]|nr:hypothetical protein [Verrucomicrobiota bacterium]
KAGGEAVTTKTVKDLIKELVDAENPAEPLSDLKIVKELEKRGLAIARRTVAKYRGELKIPPSNLRVKPGAGPASAPNDAPTAPAAEAASEEPAALYE